MSWDPGGRYFIRGGGPEGCGLSKGTSTASPSTSVVIDSAFGRGPRDDAPGAVAPFPSAAPSAPSVAVFVSSGDAFGAASSGFGVEEGACLGAGRRTRAAATIEAARSPRPPRAGRSQRGRGGFGLVRPAADVVSTRGIVADSSVAGSGSAAPEPGGIISRWAGSMPDTGGWPRQAAIASAASAAVGYRSTGPGAVR